MQVLLKRREDGLGDATVYADVVQCKFRDGDTAVKITVRYEPNEGEHGELQVLVDELAEGVEPDITECVYSFVCQTPES